MSEFVDVYDRRTGRKGRVPRRLVFQQPFCAYLRLTPLQKARDRRRQKTPAEEKK